MLMMKNVILLSCWKKLIFCEALL